jgi:hypothetical protein
MLASITHMLDLQAYGVTKKWMIITEISIDDIQKVVVLDVLDPVCLIYIHVC